MTATDAPSSLTPAHVHRMIESWCAALERRDPTAELLPYLANGLLLHLPDRTVRGADEFEHWYSRPERPEAAAALASAASGRIDVRIATPVHAEVTVQPGAPGRAPQNWWVVLRDGAPRIRSISLHRA